jgi:hypothetical protein
MMVLDDYQMRKARNCQRIYSDDTQRMINKDDRG